MKKTLSCLLAGLLMLTLFAACGSAANSPALDKAEEPMKIVTTIFPEYDWVRTLMGDMAQKAEITLLLGNGVDLHSYQPTANDIIKISSCDMFVYVGGESVDWVEAALSDAVNKDMLVVNLMEVLGEAVRQEELVEGMQQEQEHEHEHEQAELDEHVWLSLRNVQTICSHIASKLCELDEENTALYKANAEAYIAELQALDAQYQAAVDEGAVNTLVFADRFPFRYLMDDYGLDYYAAFAGCSAETEASFETIVFLAKKLDELGLNKLLIIDNSDEALAQTVINSSNAKNQEILVLDSIQSTNLKDLENGISYLSIMENNLAVLKEALAN